MIKIGSSEMFGKIRGGRGPLIDFSYFHNKTFPALLFFKIEENCQQQSCSPRKYAQLLFETHFPKINP